ncbi:type VI secretion system baseplate subunit TssG [Kistimonas asteriae]|uniref:type VI secretion system baseplate subunit TssG n=1 Tax=Kistimonas asteriae TaxID=517724 RepID=UPI001BAB0F2E|nr:type VI secretion system baseplate subunit TssG [Kistimonas asteriae]
MSSANSKPPLNDFWLFRLRNSPKDFEFIQAIRILSDSPVFQDKLSLAPYCSGEYTHAEIGDLSHAHNAYKLTVSKPALTGTHGVLPHSLRDLVRKVIYENSSYSLEDFINVFNNRLLWSQYHTDAARYLALYLESKVRQSSFEETPGFNFSGNVFNNIDNLEYHPYAISLCMNTNSLAGAEKLLSNYLKSTVTIERDKGKRWPIDHDACWKISSSSRSNEFKLGRNTVIGRHAWLLGETVNIILHYKNNIQWQKQLRYTPRFTEKVVNISRSILPFHFIRYFIEIPATESTAMILSAKRKVYRLAYHTTYYKNKKQYMRISWK